ncbi:MAG: STY4199 family HEPN domain-containing protein [Micropepsaceae bacterium]
MTTRASDVLPLVQPALVKFISFLNGAPADPAASLDDLAKSYADAKGKQGRDAVASRIGMNDAELTMFDATLREGVRRVGRLAPDAPAYETRNTTIAALRLLSWLETIADRKSDFAFAVTLPGQDDEVGRKQVRALELILRSLITERYEDQPALIARLKDLLSEKVVQQWLTSADRGDVLSGTTFSELSSLFVSTQEYPNYDPLYKDTPLLTLLKEKRVTIRNYLDDIRRIRNVLAHNKRVSPAQMSLLNMYYDELVEPLQEAHDQGRTKVNPELFLDVSREELNGYFNTLSEDVKGVKDDIADLRVELGGKLDDVKKDTAAIRETTTRIESGTGAANSKLWVVLASLVGIAAVAAAILYFVLGTSEKTDQIAGDTSATRETTDRIEDKTDRIGADTTEIKDSTARIESSIGEIADAFKRIDKNGGVIENPTSPAEHYHNALVYQERGDTANARKEYMAFAEADVDAIDVHDRFAQLLRAQDGTAGAREIYGGFASRLKAPAIKLVYAMQFIDAERTKRVEEFMTANPDYGPGYYLLAQEYSEARTGGQSVNDKQKEFDNLNKFLAADAAGTLISHFVDVQVLGQWLDTARQRVKVLEPQLQATRSQPTLVQSRNNAGWSVTFIIPEAATQIFYRLGETGEFVDTGSSGMIDQRTGKPAPNSWISLPVDQQSTTIYLKYINMNGQEMGPFALAFEAGTSALGEEHKRMLEMTWTSWILIQANPGNESQQLIYFTGMTSWRCGIGKAMYGFNGAGLDKELVFPPCDEKDPMAIPSDFMPYMEAPPGLQTMQVQVTYKDGTQSAVREYKPQ